MILIALMLFGVGISHAEEVSDQSKATVKSEKTLLNEIKNRILEMSSENNLILRDFHQQSEILANHFKDQKVGKQLENLQEQLYTAFNNRKILLKPQLKTHQEGFLNQYLTGMDKAKEMDEKCVGWYNLLDDLSFAHDIPTALTIAVWHRESSCRYYLPKNKNGPFQITSKDYGDGEITREIFVQSVEDFLNFAKHKINRYNERNAKDNLSIDLSYDQRDYTALYRFAALYNGLSGATVYGEIAPAAPKYFFENYAGEFEEGVRNGLFPQFLKVIEWEIQQ